MAALTAARSTKRKISSESPMISGMAVPVKAATKCIQGGIAVLDAGVAAPGRTATGLVAIGIFEDTADNSAGAVGAINARVRRGTFRSRPAAALTPSSRRTSARPATSSTTRPSPDRRQRHAVVRRRHHRHRLGRRVGRDRRRRRRPPPAMPLGTICIPLDLASLATPSTIQSVPGLRRPHQERSRSS
jgi:hypothetical protein